MNEQKCDIGVIGLGTMGRNFALNLADKGFAVGVYNRTQKKTAEFMRQEVGDRKVRAGRSLEEFVGLLGRPRAVLLIVSAGKAVDALIDQLSPLLDKGDLIIDGGNSHFKDTERRADRVEKMSLELPGYGHLRRGGGGPPRTQPDARRAPGRLYAV